LNEEIKTSGVGAFSGVIIGGIIGAILGDIIEYNDIKKREENKVVK